MTQLSTHKESWEATQTTKQIIEKHNVYSPDLELDLLRQGEILRERAVNLEKERIVQALENRKQELEAEYYETYGKGLGGSNLRVPSIPQQILQARISEIYEIISMVKE